MGPSGPGGGVAGWGRHRQLGPVTPRGLWCDGISSTQGLGARVGLTGLRGPGIPEGSFGP